MVKGHKDHKDSQEWLGHKGLPDHKEGRVLLASQDRMVTGDPLALKDALVTLVHLVSRDHLEPLDWLEILAQLDL